MELCKIRNLDEFRAYFQKTAAERLKVEELIAADMSCNWDDAQSVYLISLLLKKLGKYNKPISCLIGHCEACDNASRFSLDWSYRDGAMPNYRERLVCQYCGLNNRQRFMAGYLDDEINGNGSITDIYMYEQVTSFYNCIKTKYQNLNVIGSEYLGVERISGEVVNGIRHENALKMSIHEETINYVISNDVFEHVPNIDCAISEVSRILKKNGKLLFTIPFYTDRALSKERAVIKDGKVVHYLSEQYHGNPVSDKGSLVFYDFGWDLLDICINAGFKDAYMVAYYSMFYGYIGGGVQYMFVAEK